MTLLRSGRYVMNHGALCVPAPGGGGYSSEAAQFHSRITDPGTTRKDAYAAIIDALVVGSVWSKLDALWITAADIEANSLINLKSSSYALTKVSTLAFTADQGFSSDANTKYLDTGFNAATAGGNYAQNSASFGMWIRGTTVNSDVTAVMGNAASGAGQSHIFPDYAGTEFYGRINANTDSAAFGDAGGRQGLFHANRSSSSATEGYRNGSAVGAGVTNTSAALVSVTFKICKSEGGNTTNDMISAAFIGASLSSGEATSLYDALNNNKWW